MSFTRQHQIRQTALRQQFCTEMMSEECHCRGQTLFKKKHSSLFHFPDFSHPAVSVNECAESAEVSVKVQNPPEQRDSL